MKLFKTGNIDLVKSFCQTVSRTFVLNYLVYSMRGVMENSIQESFALFCQMSCRLIAWFSCLSVFSHCRYTLRSLLYIHNVVKLSLSFFSFYATFYSE